MAPGSKKPKRPRLMMIHDTTEPGHLDVMQGIMTSDGHVLSTQAYVPDTLPPLTHLPAHIESIVLPASEMPDLTKAEESTTRIRYPNSVCTYPDSVLLIILICFFLQDKPRQEWVPHRREYLSELYRADGRSDSLTSNLCRHCGILLELVCYRCMSCFGSRLMCKPCVLAIHANMPLHRIEVSYSWSMCQNSR